MSVYQVKLCRVGLFVFTHSNTSKTAGIRHSSENMLTQWKGKVHWDHLLLIISALTKPESFLVHSFYTFV